MTRHTHVLATRYNETVQSSSRCAKHGLPPAYGFLRRLKELPCPYCFRGRDCIVPVINLASYPQAFSPEPPSHGVESQPFVRELKFRLVAYSFCLKPGRPKVAMRAFKRIP